MAELIQDEEETVVLNPNEKPEPKEEEIPDEVVRKVLKSRFGEDDPEAFKTKLREADEVRGALPGYQRLLESMTAQLDAATKTKPEPKRAVREDEEEDEETLRQQARLDPYAVIKKMQVKMRKEAATMAAMAEQRGANRARGETLTDRYATQLKAEWPEAFDNKHELAQTAGYIFHEEMSEYERKQPHGFYAAAERAAARLGLPPKSRRKAEVKETRDTRDFSAQNVGGGSKRVKDEPEVAPLSAKEKTRLVRMGIDEKTYRAAKKARAEGKNIRVEDVD